jgi:hypothetical protein
LWKYEDRDGKPTKVPYQTNGKRASSTNKATWTTFDAVITAVTGYDGIGIMLGDGLAGIDLDHCRDAETGVIDEWAQAVIDHVDSYTEVSPSGEGIHVLVTAGDVLPETAAKRRGTVEFYQRDRYLTVTGNVIGDRGLRNVSLAAIHAQLFPHPSPDNGSRATTFDLRPSPSAADDVVLAAARKAVNGDATSRLLDGDYAGYDSPSEARFALVNRLAFFTQDEDQLVRLAEGAGFDRPDDERKLRNHDTPKALLELRETWNGPGGEIRSITRARDDGDEVAASDEDDAPVIVPSIPVAPFPFDALPEALAALAIAGGRASGCAPEAIATHGLSVLGAAIGNTASFRLGSWRQRSIVWSAVVARPGTAKSTALSLVRAPLDAQDLAAKHLAQERKQSGKTTPDPHRFVTDDVTAEKLGMLLSANPRGMLLAADELSGFINGMNQYKGGKGNDRQSYLKLWNGGRYTVDRIGREGIDLDEPILAVTGSTQPTHLGKLQGEDGMTGRWLVAYLEDRGRTEPTDEDIEGQCEGWASAIGILTQRSEPTEYQMSAEALAVYKAWRLDNMNRTNAEENPALADYLGKLESHVARASLVLHVASLPGPMAEIPVDVVRRAIRLVGWYADGAATHLGFDTPDPTRKPWDAALDVAVEKAHEWFRKHPGKSWKQAQASRIAGCRTPESIKALKARYLAVYGDA